MDDSESTFNCLYNWLILWLVPNFPNLVIRGYDYPRWSDLDGRTLYLTNERIPVGPDFKIVRQPGVLRL